MVFLFYKKYHNIQHYNRPFHDLYLSVKAFYILVYDKYYNGYLGIFYSQPLNQYTMK